MFPLLAKVRQIIAENRLLAKGERVIVACSGGIDSVCLLHCLYSLTEYQLDLWAVYVNHQLRPDENLAEEALLKELEDQWQIKTKIISLDLPGRLRRKPQSLQLLAREERYRLLEEFRVEIGASKIALGHQSDDQAETVLYRIIRGTGLDGLAGIPVFRDGVLIRPFLEISRAEILDYARQHQLRWAEDSSNQKPLYLRNKLRLQLLPLIEANYNPRFKEALLRLARMAGAQRDFMAGLVVKSTPQLLASEGGRSGIQLQEFLDADPYLQYYALKTMLERYHPALRLEIVVLERLRVKLVQEQFGFKSYRLPRGLILQRHGKDAFLEQVLPEAEYKLQVYQLNAPGRTVLPDLNLMAGIEKSGSTS